MKRLLDEPTDEVTRLLIRAGANHQPPRNGKLRLLASLGLGSALGLSTSEVMAWFGSGSGKVALAVTVLGTSGAGLYALASTPRAELRSQAPRAPALVISAPPELQPAPPAAPEEVAPNDVLRRVELDRAPSSPRRRAARPPGATRAAEPKTPDAPPSDTLGRRRLTEETLWVDRLRVAAELGDRTGFERLQQGYAEQFPDGQLRPEVKRLQDTL